jgi:hypothetical protein
MAAWLDASNGIMELPATISVPLIKSRLVISLIRSFRMSRAHKQIQLFGEIGHLRVSSEERSHPFTYGHDR